MRLFALAVAAAVVAGVLGVPIDFVLFGLTLAGVAEGKTGRTGRR